MSESIVQTAAVSSEASADAPSSASTTIIEPRPGWRPIDLAEIWHYRDLLFFLAWRDIKVRYKQTVLGAAWAIIQPLMTMVVLTIVFGKLGKMAEHTNVPYALLTFCAAVPWTLFAASLTQAGNSLISSQNLISKVYFPRLLIPVSSILGARGRPGRARPRRGPRARAASSGRPRARAGARSPAALGGRP